MQKPRGSAKRGGGWEARHCDTIRPFGNDHSANGTMVAVGDPLATWTIAVGVPAKASPGARWTIAVGEDARPGPRTPVAVGEGVKYPLLCIIGPVGEGAGPLLCIIAPVGEEAVALTRKAVGDAAGAVAPISEAVGVCVRVVCSVVCVIVRVSVGVITTGENCGTTTAMGEPARGVWRFLPTLRAEGVPSRAAFSEALAYRCMTGVVLLRARSWAASCTACVGAEPGRGAR